MSLGTHDAGVVRTASGETLYRPKRQRRSVGQKLLLATGAVSTVVLVLAAGVLTWAMGILGTVPFVPVEGVTQSETGVSNWLLVGTDSREGIERSDPNSGVFLNGAPEGKRTDTMIVARVDSDKSTIRLLSIPRDFWTDIPGKSGKGRINGAFNGENGATRLVAAIEQSLGIEINQYAEINFAGFRDVVDALGGVPMYFDTPMRDAGSAFSIETAGCHTLDGDQAIAFARSRGMQHFEDGSWNTDGTGDIGRATRQRYFLSRVADRAASKANLFEASEFNRVAKAAGQNLQIGAGTGSVDLLKLARAFKSVGSEGIESRSLPLVDLVVGEARVVELGEGAQEVLDQFRDLEELPEGTVNPSEITVGVLNGSGESGQATSAGSALADNGFVIGELGDAPESVSKTIVRYGPGLEAEAKTLAAFIGNDISYELTDSTSAVTLITGSNFEAVREKPEDVDGPPAPEEPTPDEPAPDAVAAEEAPGSEEAGVVPTDDDRAATCS